jgi:uncharacterized membrane protein YtjA (UPF0391 family)
MRQSRPITVVKDKQCLQREASIMSRLAILFLVIALIAGALGLWGLEGPAIRAAEILFFVFIVLALLSFIGGAWRTPPV